MGRAPDHTLCAFWGQKESRGAGGMETPLHSPHWGAEQLPPAPPVPAHHAGPGIMVNANNKAESSC